MVSGRFKKLNYGFMLKYIRLIRLPNLIIIAFTQLLIRNYLIIPAFKAEYFVTGIFPSHLSDFSFFLLTFSTVLIAAGGYIINDYFDVDIDHVNRPGTNIIGTSIPKTAAFNLFIACSLVGIVLGFYLAFSISHPVIGFVPLFSAVSLWMYSSFYKRQFLIGNLIVSLLSALSVLLPGLFEPEFYRNFIYISWYAVIAFLLSMVRELIKDMEDIEGDIQSKCKSVPIQLGLKKTKWLVLVFISLTLFYIHYILASYFYTNKVIDFWYLSFMFSIPLVALSYLVVSANEKKDFYYASLFTKVIMVIGTLTIFPLWYFFLK